jgi:tetratricopeptide (TPR) repeat protein
MIPTATAVTGVQHTGQVTNKPNISIKTELVKAKQEPHYDNKRKIYEGAFTQLKEHVTTSALSSDLEKELYSLIEHYAMDTCYGQDQEVGFRKTAALLELNLLLQLDSLGLTHAPKELQEASSLEDLVSRLGYAETENSKYFDACVNALMADTQVLVSAAEQAGIRMNLAQTLKGLSFATQNISTLKELTPDFHKRINEVTEALIGEETQEQLELLEEYRYNRAAFMVEQTHPNDVDALDHCYDKVLELSNKVYAEQPLKLDGRIAQIENMHGVLLFKKGQRKQAEPHFQKAFTVREKLLDKFETDKENFDQRQLLSNIRTALVIYCIERNELIEATGHAVELGKFIKELKERGNAHSYGTSYQGAITKVALAIGALAK